MAEERQEVKHRFPDGVLLYPETCNICDAESVVQRAFGEEKDAGLTPAALVCRWGTDGAGMGGTKKPVIVVEATSGETRPCDPSNCPGYTDVAKGRRALWVLLEMEDGPLGAPPMGY